MSSLTPEEIAYYQAHADDDLRPNQIAADVVGIVLTVTAVAARVLARFRSKAGFGWDDYLISVALMGQLSYAVLMFMSVINGEGQHIIFVKNQKLFVQEYVAAIISYSITVMLTKISILFLYHRFFPMKWLLLIAYVVGAIVVAYNLAVIFVAAFQCIPLSALWTGQSEKCINTAPPFTALAIVNVVTDIAILAIPVTPVLGLHMNTSRKVQVLTIFLLGGIVCIFGIIRTVAISNMKPVDPSYNAVNSGLWSYIEISVGILAACLPTLAPLFKHRRQNQLGNGTYASGSGSSRRWKLGRKWSTERLQDDVLLTENTYIVETWSHSGNGSNSAIQLDHHDKSSKGGEKDHRLSGIVVQREVHQMVDSV
ncbi:hypothetical protein BDV32DRAFT_123937 [Aspergillus pseudonomiae]|uniref:Rhodopsin domain-containing protein n=1 Tax=Aspergillus pseudonomiae TaxID=1506151 RepID=A0A5N7DJQ9_9EURO|nr:uncharacterized protein BDV37DRAFT_292124 [Aspergillus pseudonomiae]KAB8259684.1 hypothetical protein BDV32DRAFT_123937 [Aspergillus pseudonomiae]KAE8406584.1 hypothetical protein BDV37DRAFT_292124 [Aspergillus pseudonomiae]